MSIGTDSPHWRNGCAIVPAMGGRLLTTGEAADALGFARGTLGRWEREGRITPAVKSPGGHSRWDLEDLREQLRSQQLREE